MHTKIGAPDVVSAKVGCSIDKKGSNHRDTDIGDPSSSVNLITNGNKVLSSVI